ncbi:pseudouridine synthase [Adhaeribacter soli]|nr:pseudouridine synthase [Adhaeribacter soli]
MAYNNSRGGSGERPARRTTGSDRSSSGEGKKIFNRNDKGRSSDSRDRKPYGDSPRGGYGDKPRSSDRPYNKERGASSDRPYSKDRSYGDKPFSKDRSAGSDRPYNKDRSSSDRPYNKDRGFKSDRPYENRSSDRPSRSEGGDKEFRPYRPAANRKPTDDRPWVARAERSGQGSVPRGGKGERNRSFKPEKEEYRARQEEGKASGPRRDADGFAPREEKRSFGERPSNRPYNNDRSERPARSYDGDRKPYAKKSYGSDDKKSYGSSERGYSKDRTFNKEDRQEGSRFTKAMRASRENQGSREGGEDRAPRENRPSRDRSYNAYKAEGEKRTSSREDRPERGDRPARESRTGRPDRVADRRGRSAAPEAMGEAPNYTGLKRYSNRDKSKRSEDLSADGQLRLNRYIANAGICSRREADELIAAGEIRVNGEVITELGYKVQPTDSVQYGKKNLSREKLVYVLLNKPKDFITTTEDPEGRKTVMDLVKNASKERIFPVGRLDRNTTGLLLFTNDGELAQKLTHPSHKNSKIYQVELDKPITKDDFQKIVDGLELEDGKAEVDDLALIGNTNKFLGIEIHIGRNRIVRRIFESLGYEVVTLDRVQYAGLTKKDLPRGNWRFLTEKEVIRLKYFL